MALDFLILGAERPGASALVRLLRRHPGCAIPEAREVDCPPCTQDWLRASIATRTQTASADSRVVGDAIIGWATSADALPLIERSGGPDARIVVLLTDPARRADLEYRHACQGNEDRRDRRVLQALATKADARLAGLEAKAVIDAERSGKIDATRALALWGRRWVERFLYVSAGLYAAPVQVLLDRFGPQRLLFLFRDDLDATPDTVVDKVLTFIGLEPKLRLATCDAPPASNRVEFGRQVDGESSMHANVAAYHDDLRRLAATIPVPLPVSWYGTGRKSQRSQVRARSMANATRVVFCYYGPNIAGGPTMWVQRMLPRLKARGIETMALACHLDSGRCVVGEALRSAGVAVRQISIRGLSARNVGAILAAVWDMDPDIVVADHVTAALVGGWWLRKAGVPVVAILRSEDALYDQILDTFIHGEEAFCVEGVVAVSRELARRAARPDSTRNALMQCSSSVVLPQQRAAWRPDGFHAVYLGRINQPQKRVLHLVSALLATCRTRQTFSATLYGDGPLVDDVRRLVAEEVDSRVRYGGVLAPNEIYGRLLEAQALVLFSAYEGLSTAVQEAMACGLPVIARRTSSGVEGVMIDGETCLLIDADEELCGAVARLADDRSLWERLSANARRLAEQEFDIERAADRWAEYLKGLARRHTDGLASLPSEAEIESVLARSLVFKAALTVDEANLLIRHRMFEARGFAQFFADPAVDWERRRRTLYRAMEASYPASSAAARALIDDCPRTLIESAAGAYQVASLCRVAGMGNRAQAMFLDMLDSAPVSMRAGCHFHLGELAREAGQPEAARDHFLRCIALEPAHHAATRRLAEIRV